MALEFARERKRTKTKRIGGAVAARVAKFIDAIDEAAVRAGLPPWPGGSLPQGYLLDDPEISQIASEFANSVRKEAAKRNKPAPDVQYMVHAVSGPPFEIEISVTYRVEKE